MKLNYAHLDQLLNVALLMAAKRYDELGPLTLKLAREMALINGDMRGAQMFLREARRRASIPIPLKRELASKQNS